MIDNIVMKNGILYYQIGIPDVQNPEHIKDQPDLLEKACLWIDGCLRHRFVVEIS